LAYDSGKGEIFVANSYDNTVSVISDAGGSGIPEFPAQLGLILLTTAFIVASYALTRRARSVPRV
jgi:DNA-binding beta-propeller fold protein YncE